MSKLLTTFKGWHSRRQQLSLEGWAQERAKGKGRFVLRQAFAFTVLMTAFCDVVGYIDGVQASLWSNIIRYSLMGIFIAYVWWWDEERKYKNAQLNGRLQTSLNNHITPH